MSFGRFLPMWTVMAVAMSVNGIGRELFLKRILTEHAAEIVSAVFGIVLIGLITRWGFRPLAKGSPAVSELWMFSIALVVLTVVFETVLGRYVDRKSWSQLGEHYAFWRGELWPFVLAWVAATPFVWGRG